MPNVVFGSHSYNDLSPALVEKYSYEYPEGLSLKPNSGQHKRLKNFILERARESASIISSRYSTWRTLDEILSVYIPTDEDEKKVQQKDARKPVSIVLPYSYAILEASLAYLMAAFFQDPIFRYQGVGPEDTIGAVLLEKLIQKQIMRTKVPLALHTWFRDMLVYGVGYAAPSWTVQTGKLRIRRSLGRVGAFGRLLGRQEEVIEEEKDQILFEGNELLNIDPYLALPDTRVGAAEIQKSEYFGWIEETNLMNLLDIEKTDEDFFNCRYLKFVRPGTSAVIRGDSISNREVKTTGGQEPNSSINHPVDIIHMYINLIPSDWGLGDGEYPEKWLFSLAGDQIIVRAKPLGLNHNMFPIVSGAPDFDGHSALSVSRIEVLYGMQHMMNWLLNTHITNVRKAINDMFVVDPYQINLNDFKDPKPGKVIKLRKPAWGRGVKDAIMQLGVSDITRQNIGDVQFLMQWMNHVAGIDESMMGSLRSGGPERLTSQEFMGTRSSAISRLERIAKIISMQGMHDLAFFFASHTQQLMSNETYLDATGEWEKVLENSLGVKEDRVKVTPFDLNINYDIAPRDGSVPGGNFSKDWLGLFQVIASDPELRQRFDILRIFKYIAINLGAKNVDDFLQRGGVQAVPDEVVQQELQKGNLRRPNVNG